MIEPVLVGIGGAVGAVGRYAVGNAVRSEARIPVSTLAINVLGSFILGLATFGLDTDSGLFLLVGVGACGAFTTFSSFSYETVEALRNNPPVGVANALLNLFLCLGAVGLASVMV